MCKYLGKPLSCLGSNSKVLFLNAANFNSIQYPETNLVVQPPDGLTIKIMRVELGKMQISITAKLYSYVTNIVSHS